MEINCLTSENEPEIPQFDTKENTDHYNSLKKEKGDNLVTLNAVKKASNKRNNEKNNEHIRRELSSKVTKEDLQTLCDQLSAFNARVQTARELVQLRYDLPSALREALEVEAENLECLYAELHDAAINIDTIRNQRAALATEKVTMEAQLTRLKTDAVNELEVIVSVYDNAMLERWQTVKAGNSVSIVENFLHDVKGKLQSMKNLQLLGSQKLADLQNEGKKEVNVSKKEKRKRNKEQRVIGQSRSYRSGSNVANASQTSLPFLLDTDSEDLLDDSTVHSVLYSLVCDQVLNLPAWTQGVLDID